MLTRFLANCRPGWQDGMCCSALARRLPRLPMAGRVISTTHSKPSEFHSRQHWRQGPAAGGFVNLPAVAIILLLMLALLAGVKQSANFNRVVVSVKLLALVMFLAVAAFHLQPALWHPFMPYGWFHTSAGWIDRWRIRRGIGCVLCLSGISDRVFRRGRSPQSAARYSPGRAWLAHHLHGAVSRRGGRADRHRTIPCTERFVAGGICASPARI